MRTSLLATLALGALSIGAIACISTAVAPLESHAGSPPAGDLGTAEHRDAVMSSRFCADCHPAIYAEHRQNTHGRAFFDDEARLATRGFRRDDCIRCHTPRPVFETGIGMTPMQRWTDLEEGNTCMSCHGRAGYDYTRFVGGAECKGAFEPDVGTVTDFGPTAEPLTLTPGRHQVDLRAPGYETLVFDADVTPGQVTPFQGTLQPIRPAPSPRRSAVPREGGCRAEAG